MAGARGRASHGRIAVRSLEEKGPRMHTNGPRMSFFTKRRHCFSIFRVFRVFRGYDCFVILVCIRVHSWFK